MHAMKDRVESIHRTFCPLDLSISTVHLLSTNSNIFFAQIFSDKHFSRSYSCTKWVLYPIDDTMI